MVSKAFISFYMFWNGRLHYKGAGLFLKLLKGVLPGLQNYPIRFPGGICVHVDFRDASGIYWLHEALGEPFEEDGLVQAFRQFVKEDSVVWDVGGNCGLFSFKAIANLPVKEWQVFEPNPKVAALAEEALANRREAHVNTFALSSRNGKSKIVLPSDGSLKATLEPERTSRHGVEMEIECRRADDLVSASSGWSLPSLIKLDVEGHEIEVLSGMTHIIHMARPVIFFEHISLTDEEISQCQPENYRLLSISDKTGVLSEGFAREAGHNSVWVPEERALPH